MENSASAEMFGVQLKDPGLVALNLNDVDSVSLHDLNLTIDKKTLDLYGAKATLGSSTYLKNSFGNDGIVIRGSGIAVIDNTFDLYDRSIVYMPAYDKLHRQTRQNDGTVCSRGSVF